MAGECYQIRRNGIVLWVVDTHELRPGIYCGTVDGESADELLKDGDIIAFVSAEIVSISNDLEWSRRKAQELGIKFG